MFTSGGKGARVRVMKGVEVSALIVPTIRRRINAVQGQERQAGGSGRGKGVRPLAGKMGGEPQAGEHGASRNYRRSPRTHPPPEAQKTRRPAAHCRLGTSGTRIRGLRHSRTTAVGNCSQGKRQISGGRLSRGGYGWEKELKHAGPGTCPSMK